MASFLLALVFAVALWWLGTGIVLGLQQRLRAGGDAEEDPAAHGLALGVAAGVVGGIGALVWAGGHPGVLSSLGGFTAALILWGALELSHYLGFVTGTHRDVCPDGARGWRRFRLAIVTSMWHELSVLGIGLALLALLHDAPNSAGLHTYLVLWLMRWSAKLNLFLGVPNFSTEWFPRRLAHLASYIRRAPVSALFPVSLTLATLVAITLGRLALEAPGTRALMHALPAALLALAVVEHLFMALPVADTRLWNRVFGVRPAAGTGGATVPGSAEAGADV